MQLARPGRKRKTKVTLAVGLGVSRERASRAGEGAIELRRETPQRPPFGVRLVDWPLARLQKQGVIDAAQYEAGERYHADWYSAGLCPITVIDYARDRVDTSTTPQGPEFRAEARARFLRAAAVNGPMVSPVVDAICLAGQEIAKVESHPSLCRNKRDRTVQVKTIIEIGLDNLAIHYGFKKPP